MRTSMVATIAVMSVAAMLLLAGPSLSQAQVLHCYSSERFGTKLVKVGDSERSVIELDPDREVAIENRFGAAAGFRFDFYKRGRTIQVYVQSGVVTRICRVPD